tara:strand:+ start:58 stop:438 length:381 start_codon:yes stop_codon:yes gene_type:complete
MNIEKEFKNIVQFRVESIDEDNFINNLHLERKRRHAKKIGFINGVSAAAFLAIFGFASMNQLTDDFSVYASNDLQALEVMDEETEAYVYDIASYLVDSSDDIWETIMFFDEIQYEPIIAMNNRGIE